MSRAQSNLDFEYRGPWLGLNTTVEAGRLDPAFAREAHNVILSEGLIRPRAPWRPMLKGGHPPGIYPFSNQRVLGMYQLGNQLIVKTVQYSSVVGAVPKLWFWRNNENPQGRGFGGTTSPKPTGFLENKGWLYLLDGYQFLYRTNGDVVYRMGMTTPTNRVSPDPSPGRSDIRLVGTTPHSSGLSGRYAYACSCYDSVNNLESNIVEFPGELTLSGHWVDFTLFESRSDQWSASSADTLRLYRKNLTAGEVGFRLIAEFDADFQEREYNDDTVDGDVTLSSPETGPFGPTRNGIPAYASCGAMFGGRAFYNDVQNPGIVRFSAVGFPDYVHPDDYLDMSGDQVDRVCGLLGTDQRLYVGKPSAILHVTGTIYTPTNEIVATGAEPLESQEVIGRTRSQVGPDNQWGNGFVAAGSPQVIMFPNAAGFYLFDGLDSRVVTDLIGPTWKQFYAPATSAEQFWVGQLFSFADDVDRQILYMSHSGPGLVEHPGHPMLAYHYGINRGDGVGIWTTIDPGGAYNSNINDRYAGAICRAGVSLVKERPSETPLVVATEGVVSDRPYTIIRFSDEHATEEDFVWIPEWRYTTGLLDFTGGLRCCLQYVKWFFSRERLPRVAGEDFPFFEVKARSRMDGESSREDVVSVNLRDSEKILPVRRRGETIELSVEKSNRWLAGFSPRLGFGGFQIKYHPVGRR